MIHSIQKALWACVLAGGLANAEIWESTITNFQPHNVYIWFDTSEKKITDEYNGGYVDNRIYGKLFEIVPDLVVPYIYISHPVRHYFLASFTSSLGYDTYLDDMVDTSSSNVIYFFKDITSLDFSKPLSLDSKYYHKNIQFINSYSYEYVYLLGYGLYRDQYPLSDITHNEEYFLFQTISGYFALCYASFGVNENVDQLKTGRSIGPITLTCAVQTDGTTKFDSLPWHPDPVSVLPSVRSHKRKPGNTDLYYSADGARIHSPHRRVWQVLGE